jgi:Lrp/AsnC family transcriptional regulator, leucine-responsive regulatory protein
VTGRTPLRGLLDVTTPLPAEPVRLDDVDRRLLTLLAVDARASQRKLARDLHMSPPAVGERIARLERLGIIRGYTVDVDWTALGYFSVFVTVTAVQGADQAVILQALRRLPEVEAIVVITGSIDMLARLRVRSHAHLREVLLSEVWRIDGVQRTETFIALAEMPSKDDYVGELLALRDPDDREGDGAPGGVTGGRRPDHPVRGIEEAR